MSKVTDGQKKLLVLLLMVVVFFAAYRFGFAPMQEKAEKIEKECEQLNEEISGLKAKAKNEKKYLEAIESNAKAIKEQLAVFGPGVTPEKSILFFRDLENETGTTVSSISFGTPVLLSVTESLTGALGMPLQQYVTSYNIAYMTSYDGIKQCIDVVNQYPEKMHISNISMIYNGETDKMNGSMSVEWYSLLGTDKAYSFEDIDTVDIGTGNIFRSGE